MDDCTKETSSKSYDSATWRRRLFFEGHAIVIFIFLTTSVWCAINVLTNHHRERLSNGRRPFRSRLWYPGPITRTLPLDSVLRLAAVCWQYLIMFVLCIVFRRTCEFEIHGQHAVLYVAVGVSSLVELATCYGAFGLVIDGLDRLANMAAYLVLTVVFAFHNGHGSPLNSTMHSHVMPYGSLAIVVALFAEGVQPTSVLVALMRPYLLLFIGLYFLQVGYTLFPVFPWQSSLDGDDHRNLNIVPMLVCFHLIVAFLVMLLLNCFVVHRLRKRSFSQPANSYPLRHGMCAKCEKCEPLLATGEHVKRDI